MRTGKVAQMLGVSDRTIKTWLARPEFAPFLSAGALHVDTAQREMNQDDLFVLNTILQMRSGASRREANWGEIAEALANGRRERQLPPIAAAVDPGMALVGQVERVVSITAERDSALARVSDLERDKRELRAQLDAAVDRMTDLQNRLADDRERVLRELLQAREEVAALKAQLSLWESGRLRPSGR